MSLAEYVLPLLLTALVAVSAVCLDKGDKEPLSEIAYR